MAKAPPRNEGTARIRFIMLDAEIPSGDIEQVTQAIQNALRPTTVVQQRIGTPAETRTLLRDPKPLPAYVIDGESAEVPDEIEDEPSTPESQPARTNRPRSYRTPEVLDIDLKSEPSWENFAALRKLETDLDRFLTVAAWFKEARKIDTITVDHVYTCYKASKWSTNISDFSAPLRKLKHIQLVKSSGKGEYTINHLGIDRVEKLGNN